VPAYHSGNDRREIGHIERPRDAVDERDADQEEQRRPDVDRDIVKSCLDALGAKSMQQHPVGSGEQNLEEDEEIEKIAREERAVQAHDLQEEQGLERSEER